MTAFFVNTSQKILKASLSGFFHLCRKAQHHLTEGQHHFERSENIIALLRHKTMLRQVANDVLRNDVMLRIIDVLLRASKSFIDVC